jgi:small subunit ribosomal protein S10
MANAQKIRIKIRSFDHMIIDQVSRLIIQTAEDTGAIVAGPIPLPTKIEKFTVLKSTFVHKNSREQYEIRTHHRLIDIKEIAPQTIDALTNLSLPSGVNIEIKMLTDGATKSTKEIEPKPKKAASKSKSKK